MTALQLPPGNTKNTRIASAYGCFFISRATVVVLDVNIERH